jgi:2-oxoglutarate ferredoxin oxidoreductase subunit delta
MKGTIHIDHELCKGCCLCVEFCPKGALTPTKKLNLKGYCFTEFDAQQGCTGCATCALVCPEVAIEVYRE